MPNISDFRSKINARMNHVIDTSTQKLVRELLDYAEALEKKVSVFPPKQPVVLLGPKDIEETASTKSAVSAKRSGSTEDPTKVSQPIIVLGPKGGKPIKKKKKTVSDSSDTTTETSGDPTKVSQPVVVLGPKDIEEANGSRARNAEDPTKVSQPVVVLGPKGTKPVKPAKNKKKAVV
jgi:hypothetical protein